MKATRQLGKARVGAAHVGEGHCVPAANPLGFCWASAGSAVWRDHSSSWQRDYRRGFIHPQTPLITKSKELNMPLVFTTQTKHSEFHFFKGQPGNPLPRGTCHLSEGQYLNQMKPVP